MAKRAKKPKAEKVDWRRMPELDPIIDELVRKHHKHLERAKILALGKPKASKRWGRLVVATAKRASDALNALVRDEVGDIAYVIEIGLDVWDSMDMKKRRIELDRALMYFSGRNDKDRWTMRRPDVEAFNTE